MKNSLIQNAIEIAGGQIALAEKTGLSQAAISKLLTRKSKQPRLSTIKALSEATGISIDEFFKEPTP